MHVHVYILLISIVHIHTVLVAHNGFSYDFPLLLAEIERRPKELSTANLSHCRLFFADTLLHLRQIRFSHEVFSQVFFTDTIPHAPAPGLLHELLHFLSITCRLKRMAIQP